MFGPTPIVLSNDSVRPCLMSQPVVVQAPIPKAFARTTNISFGASFGEVYNASQSFKAFGNATLPELTPVILEALSLARMHARDFSWFGIQVFVAVLALVAFRHAACVRRQRTQVIVGGVRHSRRCRLSLSETCKSYKRFMFAMLLFGQEAQAFGGPDIANAVATVQTPPQMSGSLVRAAKQVQAAETSQLSHQAVSMPTHAANAMPWHIRAAMIAMPVAIVCIIFMMYPGTGNQTMRMPPVFDPNDQNQSFRAWSQDLMLWSVSNDLQPHQQAAMIIAQLRGPAREMARAITPAELYNGGMHNGVQLDPVSYILQGLASRFAPLDDESRLRAAQELLSFTRRSHESIDGLITRFDLVRTRARQEGGGATVSTETAALLLLRACNCTSEQFQALTQPFGYRLPSTEEDFVRLCSHIRRLGHIVERQPLNIASTLRQGQHQQHFLVDEEQGQPQQQWPSEGGWGAQPAASNLFGEAMQQHGLIL